MSGDIIDKERKIKDTEKLYMNLRDVLSKQRDPRVAANLDKVQSVLRKRGEKLKVRNGKLTVEKFTKKPCFVFSITLVVPYRTLKLIINLLLCITAALQRHCKTSVFRVVSRRRGKHVRDASGRVQKRHDENGQWNVRIKKEVLRSKEEVPENERDHCEISLRAHSSVCAGIQCEILRGWFQYDDTYTERLLSRVSEKIIKWTIE